MPARLPAPAAVVFEAAMGVAGVTSRDAVAVVGIGRLKASKNAGVPKVSVKAMAN